MREHLRKGGKSPYTKILWILPHVKCINFSEMEIMEALKEMCSKQSVKFMYDFKVQGVRKILPDEKVEKIFWSPSVGRSVGQSVIIF